MNLMRRIERTQIEEEEKVNESELPEEARKLPTMNIEEDLDHKDLYFLHDTGVVCKRCVGAKQDPDGDYPCLLCHGKGTEPHSGERTRMCVIHPEQKLVNIGKRHITWECWGFDHEGFVAVEGCPICKVPAYSVKSM